MSVCKRKRKLWITWCLEWLGYTLLLSSSWIKYVLMTPSVKTKCAPFPSLLQISQALLFLFYIYIFFKSVHGVLKNIYIYIYILLRSTSLTKVQCFEIMFLIRFSIWNTEFIFYHWEALLLESCLALVNDKRNTVYVSHELVHFQKMCADVCHQMYIFSICFVDLFIQVVTFKEQVTSFAREQNLIPWKSKCWL